MWPKLAISAGRSWQILLAHCCPLLIHSRRGLCVGVGASVSVVFGVGVGNSFSVSFGVVAGGALILKCGFPKQY